MPFRKPARTRSARPAASSSPGLAPPTASDAGSHQPSPLVPPCVDAVLSASIEVLCRRSVGTADPLAGEMLGSDASGIWWMPSSAYGAPGTDFERRIGYAYASALDLRGGEDALAALRSLQVGGAPGIAAAVAPTADRLAARGVADPPWWPCVNGLRAVGAAELSGPDDDHRTRIVLIELERRGERLTLGVMTDAGAAGVAASISVFDDLSAVRGALAAYPAGPGSLDELVRPLTIEQARGRVLRAIERTDLLGTCDRYGPGFVGLRGLTLRWMDRIAPDAGAQAA